MSEAEVKPGHAQGLDQGSGAAMEAKQGPARAEAKDFDIDPGTTGAESGADGFEESLFGGEPNSQGRRGHREAEAVLQFAGCE
ncbi:MAG TPA: hypothetical protein VK864_14775 [Longimicrobiales bacterium]|nr:hypothetical protein [Longimicrobiales bacterium]